MKAGAQKPAGRWTRSAKGMIGWVFQDWDPPCATQHVYIHSHICIYSIYIYVDTHAKHAHALRVELSTEQTAGQGGIVTFKHKGPLQT